MLVVIAGYHMSIRRKESQLDYGWCINGYATSKDDTFRGLMVVAPWSRAKVRDCLQPVDTCDVSATLGWQLLWVRLTGILVYTVLA